MRKLIISLIVLLSSAISLAQVKDDVTNIQILQDVRGCKSQTLDFLKSLSLARDWTYSGPSAEGKRYRAPSKNFGTWYELEIATDGKSTVAETSKKISIKTSWNNACKASAENRAGLNFEKNVEGNYFDDEDLQRVLDENDSGIIYLWSPGMVYSAKYLNDYKEIAKKLKIKFVALVDAKASKKSISELQKTFAIDDPGARLNSVELYMRGMTVHYPSAILFYKKKLIDPFIVGVFPRAELEIEIKKSIKGLN